MAGVLVVSPMIQPITRQRLLAAASAAAGKGSAAVADAVLITIANDIQRERIALEAQSLSSLFDGSPQLFMLRAFERNLRILAGEDPGRL